MDRSTEAIKKLIAECSPDEQRALRQYLSTIVPHPLESEWGIDADTILSAIRRSSDLTKRGVRGIIAEAVFETSVLPSLAESGWKRATVVGNVSYDAHVEKGEASARIQIKLQRLEKSVPKLYYPKRYEGAPYVVEVQKTRTGERIAKEPLQRRRFHFRCCDYHYYQDPTVPFWGIRYSRSQYAPILWRLEEFSLYGCILAPAQEQRSHSDRDFSASCCNAE